MTGSRQRRKEATFRAGREEGLATAEADRNLFKGKYLSIVALLNTTRQQIQEIFDHVDDEGDRRYFGSTNHVDWLRDLLDDMDGWSIDAMLPKGDINKMEADPYAEIRAQRARAEAAEAEVKRMREASTPFATISKGWVNEEGWTDIACQRDRIVDWFGPSDFRSLHQALASTGGEHHAE